MFSRGGSDALSHIGGKVGGSGFRFQLKLAFSNACSLRGGKIPELYKCHVDCAMRLFRKANREDLTASCRQGK